MPADQEQVDFSGQYTNTNKNGWKERVRRNQRMYAAQAMKQKTTKKQSVILSFYMNNPQSSAYMSSETFAQIEEGHYII